MRKRANPVTIGLFVVLACVIFVGALVFFGIAKANQRNPQFVLFFNESVNGLEVGARVKFKGVSVGRVRSIRIRMPEQRDDSDAIPVIIELENQRIRTDLGAEMDLADREVISLQVRQGLRARLNTESLITGLLFVQLDYVASETPYRYHQKVQRIAEIPTELSQLQEIAGRATEAIAKIGSIDFEELGKNLNRIFSFAADSFEEVDVGGIARRIETILDEFEKNIASGQIEQTLTTLNEAIAKIGNLGGTLDAEIPPLVDGIQNSLSNLNQTLLSAQSSLGAFEGAVGEDSSLTSGINSVVRDVRTLSESLRDLSGYLERNPNSVVFGRRDL